MKIKLLYIVNSLGKGGSEKVLVDILQNIDYKIFEVTVCMLSNENIYEQIIQSLPIRLVSLNIPINGYSKFKHLFYSFKLYKLLKKISPLIVHTQDLDADLYGQIIGRIAGVRKIITSLHGIDYLRYNPALASWKYRIKIVIENCSINNCCAVITVSERIQKYALEKRNIPIKNIFIIRNTTKLHKRTINNQLAKEQYFGTNTPIVIGTICRITSEKNIILALSAFKLIWNKYRNSKLIIVGDGPDLQLAETYTQENYLQDSVVFTGWKSDVHDILELLDVMLITSYVEGGPLTLLEAMSLKVPVVSTFVGMTTEIIEDGYSGLLVHSSGEEHLAKVIGQGAPHDVSSSQDFADAIEKIFINPQHAEYLADNAYNTFIRECSLEKNVKQLEGLYRSVLHL